LKPNLRRRTVEWVCKTTVRFKWIAAQHASV